MNAKRIVKTDDGSNYLTPELPIFVNRVQESFALEQHNHAFVEINYVSEGNGFQYIEGRTIPVVKGDLFYLPVGASHVFRPVSPQKDRNRLIVYNCLLGESFVRQLEEAFPLGKDLSRMLTSAYPEQPWLHIKDRDGVFQRLFDSLQEEYTRKQADFYPILQAETVRLLVHIRRFWLTASSSGPAALTDGASAQPVEAATDPLDRAIALMRAKLEETFSVTQLAAHAGLSERHFRRRFAERTGMGYTDYVHKMRVEASCELLLTTTDKVASIAQRVGYQDIKFFNRLFKSKTGMTPREFRGAARKRQNAALDAKGGVC
ncbi:helix-turn-helix domain-containing protein [Paenibacillus sp. MBLB4367]|uniref:helix-turn-helix domain-containing protein n=1 Tax=Paenibacillus sp. MBLB4367 TaxID=3384767 RepID=UPI0039082409